ncbi:MAG: AAA-like domain-containing protein [Rivularia sp. ALOHA_DT_140]|nr:AAA-like domain-containing protein [Rivularia sp. ALOHA_DT_140]
MTVSNSNCYQVGARLPVDAPSYVKRQADEVFYQKLRDGRFCYVLNSRQMGKSSLRVRTMQRLQNEGTVCAAIDLTGIGKVTQQQWYGGIVYNLSESCQLEDKFDFDWQEWWGKYQNILSPVQCLGLFIEKVLLAKIQQPIVIFVDEIDKVLSQDFSADDFFGLIRFFQNQRVDNPIFQRLTFALLGVATPGDLIQNKTQTPFNIGEAIELHGFQINEVEPLIKGLQERFDNPQMVMKSILDWTGGQPFLTQKLCKFMVDEDDSVLVKEVVKSRIIENWESQDDPEHLRTIRDRILSSEQRAGYLLELYQQIQQKGEVAAKKNLESSELRLSGLVVQREGKLRVYNRVYQKVFNQHWVEVQLKNLRPYSEAFRFWVASGGKDESRLLRGLALESAEEWAKDKNLSFQDKQFLAASREKEIQEKIAVEEREAQLERERKDKEAGEKRNLVLSEANKKLAIANKKALRRTRIGSIILVLTLLGSVISIDRTGKDIQDIQETTELISQLSKLSGELYKQDKSSAASQAREQIGLAYEVPNHELRKAMIKIYKFKAFQQLEKFNKAKNEIKESLHILKNFNKESNQVLQIKVLAYKAKSDLLLAQKKEKNKVMEPLKSAFEIIDRNPEKTNPFERDKQILTDEDIESVHRGLLNLQPNRNPEVWNSLKEHFYARLENSLKSKDWRTADLTTDTLMLFIADREEERYLDTLKIENFSCNELKRMDSLWVKNSQGHFGFSVQKRIWKNIFKGVKPEDWKNIDFKNYLLFASRVRWYNYKKNNSKESNFVQYGDYINMVNKDPSQYTGGLPGYLWGVKAIRQWVGFLFSHCDL